MNANTQQLPKSQSLMDIANLIKNKSVFLTLFLTMLGSLLVFLLFVGIGASMPNKVGGIVATIGFLIASLVFVVGFSASGFLMTDLIHNRPQRTKIEAFWASVVTLPRLFGVLLMILVLALLALLVSAILLFIAKIPVVGPILFFFIFPACVVISAATIFALLYVAVLSAPSIWSGQTAFKTISTLGAILKDKLFAVAIQQFLLGFVVVLTVSLLFSVVSGATSFTSLLAIPILDIHPSNFVGAASSVITGSGMRYLNGYMIAGGMSFALMAIALFTLPLLMFVAGNCLIFKNATVDLNTDEIEKSLQARLSSIKEKSAAAKEKMNKAANPLPPSSMTTEPEIISANIRCTACGEMLSSGDVFCFSCGNKVK